MKKSSISAEFPYQSRFIDVLGSNIHYIEQGSGDPILFLHSMPTNNYIWRNVIPHLSRLGRCIAPDMIGYGKSDKPDIQYSINDHIKYINQFIETLNLKKITLVMHGWGSIIGFNYAMDNEKNCKGLAFYESFLRPLRSEDFPLPLQEQIALVEIEEKNYDLVTNGVAFIDQVLPQTMMRPLSEKEMAYYRQPFLAKGAGKPLKQFWQELPRGRGDSEVDKNIEHYAKKLLKSKLPKLLLYSLPGFITTISNVMWAKENLINLEVVEVGEGYHYAQEVNPTIIGEAISIWLQGIEQLA